jgi:hypothetical protein
MTSSANVGLVDSAVRLGPAPARDSYLSVAVVLNAVRRSGANDYASGAWLVPHTTRTLIRRDAAPTHVESQAKS